MCPSLFSDASKKRSSGQRTLLQSVAKQRPPPTQSTGVDENRQGGTDGTEFDNTKDDTAADYAQRRPHDPGGVPPTLRGLLGGLEVRVDRRHCLHGFSAQR